jgi:hypothetical protein
MATCTVISRSTTRQISTSALIVIDGAVAEDHQWAGEPARDEAAPGAVTPGPHSVLKRP